MEQIEQIEPLESLPPSPKENLPDLEPLKESKGQDSGSAFHASLEETQVKRGRGRPRKDGSAPQASNTIPENVVSAKERKALQTEERKKKCEVAGEISAKMLLGTLASFGPDYVLSFEVPHEKQAADMAITSTAEFFEHMDWADMPPTIGFIVAWGNVGFTIANKPANKPKVSALVDRLKARFLNWRASKKAD